MLVSTTSHGEDRIRAALVDRHVGDGHDAVIIELNTSRYGGSGCVVVGGKVVARAVVFDRAKSTSAWSAAGVGGHECEGFGSVKVRFLLWGKCYANEQSGAIEANDVARGVINPARAVEILQRGEIVAVTILVCEGERQLLVSTTSHGEDRIR